MENDDSLNKDYAETLGLTKFWAMQKNATVILHAYLSQTLPIIGGPDWWKNLVKPQCIDLDRKNLLEVGKLETVDILYLLKIALACYAELAKYSNIDKHQMKVMLINCKDARNKNSHAGVHGIRLDAQIEYIGYYDKLMSTLEFTLITKDSSTTKALQSLQLIYKEVRDIKNTSTQKQIQLNLSTSRTPTRVPKREFSLPIPPISPIPINDKYDRVSKVPKITKKESTIIKTENLSRGRWLMDPSADKKDIEKIIKNKTYVGIDFGTSTTVVSIIMQDDKDRSIGPVALDIEQLDQDENPTHSHLVNTVLAWDEKQKQILFGESAYRLRQEFREGKNVFSSFKMKLGVNLGPIYPLTQLNRKAQKGYIVETASDATREFFKMLIEGTKKALAKKELPSEIVLAVSVPASFEANQRRDLLECIKEVGVDVHEGCLMDEPNAAFLSFIHDTARRDQNTKILNLLKDRPIKIMVYDFGAGTCDVSILEISTKNDIFSSKNRSISRFMALGGDDIDRAIAKEILLPQLLMDSCEPGYTEIEDIIIPRLQPVAERLKIAAVDWMSTRKIENLEMLRLNEKEFSDYAIPDITISRSSKKHRLTLSKPRMTTSAFARVLDPFMGNFNQQESTQHIFSPAADAIDKSGLTPEDLDIVLFIGGSCENPIVRSSVLSNLPKKIIPVIPRDLRKHVSHGTALHSMGFNGFGFNFIKPITPESIFIVTKGGILETILPASSEVPSEKPFVTKLLVQKRGQKIIEMPVCVSNENKILSIIKIESKTSQGFSEKEEVTVECRLTKDKLLDVKTRVGQLEVKNITLNPLSNQTLSPNEMEWLEQKQVLNTFQLNNPKKLPSKEMLIAYANVAYNAKKYEIAADAYVAVERVDPDEDQATNICVAYSRTDRDRRANEYAKIAYERNPNEVTAYNLAIRGEASNKILLLKKSLNHDPNFTPSLLVLGQLLIDTSEKKSGRQMLEKCKDLLADQLKKHTITENGCRNLISASDLLGDRALEEAAQARLNSLNNASGNHDRYNDDNLTITKSKTPLAERSE